MPYYRRRKRYGRKPYRRGRTRRKTSRIQRLCNDRSASRWNAGSVASAAYTALKLANRFAGVLNTEFKVKDTEVSQESVGTTPTITRLTEIAQGDDTDERSGNEILLKSLLMNIKLVQNGSGTNSTVAMWVVIDKNADGVLPSYSSIFKEPAVNTNRVIALRNDEYTERFVVVKKFIWKLSDNGTKSYNLSKMIALNIHTKFDGPSDEIEDTKANQVYLIMVSDEATNKPYLTVMNRLRYVDN